MQAATAQPDAAAPATPRPAQSCRQANTRRPPYSQSERSIRIAPAEAPRQLVRWSWPPAVNHPPVRATNDPDATPGTRRAAQCRARSRRERLQPTCAELDIAARYINEIVGVNNQRTQIVLLAQTAHRLATALAPVRRVPLPRPTRRSETRCIRAVSTFGGIFHAAGGRSMYSDAARCELRRRFRRRNQLQDVVLSFGRFVGAEGMCNIAHQSHGLQRTHPWHSNRTTPRTICKLC